MRFQLLACALAAAVLGVIPSAAFAQRLNLYQSQATGQPLVLENHSWLYVQMPPAREIQINDLITIIVDQKQQTQSAGQVSRVTQSNIDARLRDWLELDGFGIKLAPQRAGDPRARGSLDSQVRTTADLENSNRMSFRITATVVDIRPNGNLVLEAHTSERDNQEVFEKSLSGIVRREDVLPNNTVMSEKIAELCVYKRETGHIHDAVRRGWALKFYDAIKPF